MTAKVSAAFVKAQAEIGKAIKDSTNPHFKNNYADLSSVVDAIKPALEKNGLSFLQRFHENTDGVTVETIIIHESGESLSNGVLSVPATKKDAQGFGSACTYARRYSLQAAFGVAPDDDDGNAASRKPEARGPAAKPFIADARLTGAIKAISDGKYTTDKLREDFSLTAAQESKLQAALVQPKQEGVAV